MPEQETMTIDERRKYLRIVQPGTGKLIARAVVCCWMRWRR